MKEIAVNAISAPISKASEYNGVPFGVISYISPVEPGTAWSGVSLTSAYEYFQGRFVDKGSGVFGGDPPRYWPLGNEYSLIFAGYSPYVKADGVTSVDVQFSIDSKTLTFEDYVVEPCAGTQSDLMFFLPDTDGTGNYFVGVGYEGNAAYDVLFRHALSQVLFNVSVKPGDESLVEVGDIILENVVFKGDCVISSGNTVVWSRSVSDDDKRDETIQSNSTALIIPGESYQIQLTYDLKLNGKVLTETAYLDVDPIDYASGYRYIYNVIIGTSAISVESDVKLWEDK